MVLRYAAQILRSPLARPSVSRSLLSQAPHHTSTFLHEFVSTHPQRIHVHTYTRWHKRNDHTNQFRLLQVRIHSPNIAGSLQASGTSTLLQVPRFSSKAPRPYRKTPDHRPTKISKNSPSSSIMLPTKQLQAQISSVRKKLEADRGSATPR